MTERVAVAFSRDGTGCERSGRRDYNLRMMNAPRLYQTLLRFYDQRGLSGAPWPVLNKPSDEQLQQHLALNRWLEEESEPNTSQHAHARIFSAWIAQAMMVRRFRSEFPHIVA